MLSLFLDFEFEGDSFLPFVDLSPLGSVHLPCFLSRASLDPGLDLFFYSTEVERLE